MSEKMNEKMENMEKTETEVKKDRFTKVKALPKKAKDFAGKHKKAIIGGVLALGTGILAGYKINKAMNDIDDEPDCDDQTEDYVDYGRTLNMKFVDPESGEDYDMGDKEIRCSESYAKEMIDECSVDKEETEEEENSEK